MSAADRRAQLVDAAADIVAAAGVNALTIEAVVAKVGAHRPTVYRHFANADELLDAVIARELALLRHSTDEAVAGVVGFDARIRAAVTAWMEQFASNSSMMRVSLLGRPSNEVLRARRQQQNEQSVRFLAEEYISAGVPADDARLAATAMLHALVGIVNLWAQRRITRTVAIDRYVRIVCATRDAFMEDRVETRPSDSSV